MYIYESVAILWLQNNSIAIPPNHNKIYTPVLTIILHTINNAINCTLKLSVSKIIMDRQILVSLVNLGISLI